MSVTPLFSLVALLAAVPILYAPAGPWAVTALFGLMLWTALRVKRTPQAAAESGEDTSATKGSVI